MMVEVEVVVVETWADFLLFVGDRSCVYHE